MAFSAWHLVKTIVGLEFLEQQLDLPAQSIRVRYLLAVEPFKRNSCDKQMIFLRLLVTDSYYAKHVCVRAPDTLVGAAFKSHIYHDVQFFSPES